MQSRGTIKMIKLLNPAYNGLKNAPPENKFLLSILLASMWGIAFGIFTAELLFIGYNIIGHIALIFCVFVTWTAFKYTKKRFDPATSNKVKWDMEKEA